MNGAGGLKPATRGATAVAHPNIALAKYWGKREVAGNVPATPSVSLTLEGLEGGGLETRTTVEFDERLDDDALTLNDISLGGEPLARARLLLDDVRKRSGVRMRARVVSQNGFPTASGLASSASGFAALARAACAAAGLDVPDTEVSRIARRASASAARSVFGGFVALGTEDDAAAEVIASPSHWSIRMVVATVTVAAKDVPSTRGMEHTRKTSPFYAAWLDDAPTIAAEVRAAIVARDLERLGAATETSATRMHACAWGASPPIVYWLPATLALLAEVRALRASGVPAWATIDAGPHVKVLTSADHASAVAARLAPQAVQTIVAGPGDGARVTEAWS